MTTRDNQTKLLTLIQEAFAYNKPSDNKVELLEDTLLASGLTKEFVALGLKKLAEDGVIELQQVFYAPNRTPSNYETDTKYKVPADALYNKPVYVLHINRKKLESLPSVSAARFEDGEAAIYFGSTKVGLPPHRGEHVLCRIMFEHSINEPISWDVIYEEVAGKHLTEVDKEADNRAKRKIYDITEAINKRIAEATGESEMFVWQGTTIKRTR